MQSDDERLNPESGKKLKTAEWVKAFVDILRTDGGLSLGTVLKAVLATQTKILGEAVDGRLGAALLHVEGLELLVHNLAAASLGQ